MKLSSLFACFSSGSKKAAKKQVQQELQDVAVNAPKAVVKDTVVLSSSPVSSSAKKVITREEALQQVKEARELLRAQSAQRELKKAELVQKQMLRKAKSKHNVKAAERLEAMSVEQFHAFHQGVKAKKAKALN